MKMNRLVPLFTPIFFLVLLLSFSSVKGDRDGDGGEGFTPSSPSSSVACASDPNLNGKLIPFNTSSFSCNDAWSSQSFMLMFKQSGANLWSFILRAPDNNAYISIGFSPSGRMIGASAIAGWIPSTGGGVVKQYSLNSYSSSSCPPDKGSLKIVSGSSTIYSVSGKLYLAFQLDTPTPESRLIFAVGPPGLFPASDNLLPQHQTMTAATINYATGQSSPSSPPSGTGSTSFSSTPPSSGSCTTDLNVDTKLLQFDTSSLKCYKAWNSQDFTLMYKQNGPSLWSFILSSPDTNAYISIGFSPNGRMVGTNAISGWRSSSGVGIVKQYRLGGYSSNECPPDQGTLRLVPNTTMILSQSSRLYLAFQLNTIQPGMNLIYAIGPSGNLPSSDYYLPTHMDMTATTLNYATGESSTSDGSNLNLKRFHGSLGLISWGVLVPLGVAAARYFKDWDPIWFYTHTSVQAIGFVLGLACTISGFNLENKVGVSVVKHKALGIFITVLGCLQVMAILARPDKGSKIRRYWNWYHHNVGRVAIACAVANVFYGFHLAKEDSSWSVGFGISLGVLLAAFLVLEARLWLKK